MVAKYFDQTIVKLARGQAWGSFGMSGYKMASLAASYSVTATCGFLQRWSVLTPEFTLTVSISQTKK